MTKLSQAGHRFCIDVLWGCIMDQAEGFCRKPHFNTYFAWLFLCVCVHVHVGVCTCAYRLKYGCLWRPEVVLSVFLGHSLPYFLQQGVLLNLELMDSARLAGQWATGVCLSLLLSTGISDLHHHTLIFIWILDIWTQGLCGKHFTNITTSPAPPWLFVNGSMKPETF